jgi:tripartite-type tricarboxylate transporter receptor subunit TctC
MKALFKSVRRRALLATAAFALLSPLQAAEPSWPNKLIRIVVAGTPGGTVDILARIIAPELQAAFGQPVIVDYRAGAAGTIAVQNLLSARDGYTFLLIQKGIVSEVPNTMKVSFDPFKDLVPLAQISRQSLVLVGNPNLPAKNLAELVAYMKANPNKLAFANYASGMRGHTTAVQFSRLANVDAGHIAYKGTPPAMTDVMGGHVALLLADPSSLLPSIQAGKLRAYAVGSPKRIAVMPDVPTFAEQGYADLQEISWMALWSAAGVPQPVMDRVRQATLKALQKPEVRSKIEASGVEAGLPLTTEELATDARNSFVRQAKLLRSINFTVE